MSDEYKAQLNIKQGDHMINLRDEAITTEQLNACLEVLNNYESANESEQIVNSMANTPPPKAVAQTDGGEAGNCPVHQKAFVRREGSYGVFYSCGTKLDDGTWCKEKPAKMPVTKDDIPF